jgi:HNH endonuclease
MISAKKRNSVFERAHFRCEYCLSRLSHSIQPFGVEHIIPEVKDRTDDLENLACACGGCNGHKFTKTHASDPFDNQLVPLYHPRLMDWHEHFVWSDDYLEIIGTSSIGRATINTLVLNRISAWTKLFSMNFDKVKELCQSQKPS